MVNAARNLIVGLVFLGSLGILGVATLKISSIPFLNKAEALSVRFASVDQLEQGDDVVIHGLRVGQVDRISYDPDTAPATPIVVECSVPREILGRIGSGTSFKVYSAGPLGGRYLEIQPAPPNDKPQAPTSAFVGEATGDLFKQLAQLVQENGKVTQLLENMNSAVNEFKETFRSANVGEGLLGRLIRDKGMGDKAEKLISDASETIAKLREDVTNDKGIVSYLLRDEKAKESLRSTVERLNEIITEVKEGGGIASRLINDKELANQLSAIIADFHDVVHKVNTGQGTLGQIVNNPKAWDELVRILVLGRETIEDLREQAPVSTFVNAAFAAF